MSQPNNRILVVGPAWVGDMVMAQSLFKTLKQNHPDCPIDVLAPDWSKPILQRMPEVNGIINQPLGHGSLGLMTRYRLGRSLRDNHYSRAITTPRSFKSALIPFFARVPQRTGYKGEQRYGLINDMRALDKALLTQTVQRYVALGRDAASKLPPPVPRPTLDIDRDNQTQLLDELGLNLDRPVIGFMPGAEYGPAKQWPAEYFAELAQTLIDKGFQVWLLGSDKDSATAHTICDGIDQYCVNLCGKTQLVDVVDLLALAKLAVTNDSGLMHIAAAVGCHVVAVYGSSTPDYTPPLTDKATILYQNLECSPCFERNCPLGHTRCLTSISADDVMNKIEQLSQEVR